MTWLTYLNENKNTLIVAVSGAMLADCIVLFAFRRYFKNCILSCDEALEILRADVASLRSEVLTLRGIVEEISGGPIKIPQNGVRENEDQHCCIRSKDELGCWQKSSSVLSLSSENSYFDAMEEWYDKKPSGEVTVYDDENIAKLAAETDAFLEQQDGFSAYKFLNGVFEKDVSAESHSELLWRLAKACHVYANTFDKKDPKRKILIFEGRNCALKACGANGNSYEPLRWAAIMTGLSTDYVNMKERIRLGKQFKEYLDKAIALQPSEYSLLHMRGRYSFTVANLSWLERKAASALFGAVPQATIEEALDDLLAVERLKPGTWIDNLLFLAKCYIVKKEEFNAVNYLMTASRLRPENDAEAESLREVNALLETYGK